MNAISWASPPNMVLVLTISREARGEWGKSAFGSWICFSRYTLPWHCHGDVIKKTYMWTPCPWAKWWWPLKSNIRIGSWAQTSLVFVGWKRNVNLFMQLPCWWIWCEIERLCGCGLKINSTTTTTTRTHTSLVRLWIHSTSRIVDEGGDDCHIHCIYPERDIGKPWFTSSLLKTCTLCVCTKYQFSPSPCIQWINMSTGCCINGKTWPPNPSQAHRNRPVCILLGQSKGWTTGERVEREEEQERICACQQGNMTLDGPCGCKKSIHHSSFWCKQLLIIWNHNLDFDFWFQGGGDNHRCALTYIYIYTFTLVQYTAEQLWFK